MAQPARTTSRQQPKTTTPTSKQRSARTPKGNSGVRPFNMPFESKNILYIVIGIGVVTLGYVIMGTSETMGFMALNVSPIVLLLGYLVVIPLGIMYGSRKKKADTTTESTETVSV